MGRASQLQKTGVASQSVQRYQLTYIRPYHREIARRLVLGQKQSEVARDMDINIGRLSIICNSPAMLAEIARIEEMRDSGVQDVTIQLQELSPTMLEVCERIAVYGEKETTRLSAAQDILDRAGYSKVTKVDAVILHETHEQRLSRIMGVSKAELDITPIKDEGEYDVDNIPNEIKDESQNALEGSN